MMKKIGALSVVIILVVLSIIWSAYVFSLLWKWFIVKQFAVNTLSISSAIGITLVIRYLVPTQDNEITNKSSIIESFLKPLFILILGWFVTLF